MKLTNAPPSSMFSAKAVPKSAAPITTATRRISRVGLILRLGQRGRLVRDHQAGSGEGQRRTKQRDPAAVHDVDQTTELERDAEEDERDVDQRSNSGGLGATDPAHPDPASGLDQPGADDEARDEQAEHHTEVLQRRGIRDKGHAVERLGTSRPMARRRRQPEPRRQRFRASARSGRRVVAAPA